MKILKNNIWTILALAVVGVIATTGGAFAQADSIEDIAIDKATSVFEAARNVMFVVGGFGLIAIAFLAITGKMNWKWVGQLAIGLGIIAAASAVINFAITKDGTGGAAKFDADQFSDTLKN